MSAKYYQERRNRLMQIIGEDSIALVPAAPEMPYSPDIAYPYRQNPNLYYLTGYTEPEAIAVFVPGRAEGEYILFNQAHDEVAEAWMGPRPGQEGALYEYGADQAFPIEQFVELLPKLVHDRAKVYLLLLADSPLVQQVLTAATMVSLENIEPHLQSMRLIKDKFEQDLMRQSAQMAANAHSLAMQSCKPGMMEYELDALFLYEFKRNGCVGPSYPSIVGAGNNATILHYHANNCKINNGDLVLVDAGCEYKGYASDITRTYPTNGKFSDDQRALYEAVLYVQKKVIALVKPGFNVQEYMRIARELITEVCVELGLLQGDPKVLYEQQAYRKFYMHNLGHWIGLDAHDRMKISDSLLFSAGMVITAEPGLYIAHGTEGVDEKWWGMGIRIEDVILVTETGAEVLTAGVPKEVAEIEALMAAVPAI